MSGTTTSLTSDFFSVRFLCVNISCYYLITMAPTVSTINWSLLTFHYLLTKKLFVNEQKIFPTAFRVMGSILCASLRDIYLRTNKQQRCASACC